LSSGIGFNELVVLFVIGLLILGPERLPRVATQIGRWVGRARRTANQLRYQLEREIALADIENKSSDKKHDRKQAEQKPEGSENTARADETSGTKTSPGSENSIDRAGESESADEEPEKPKQDG
jgi:sec-independent protein translocase protein TatB